MILVASFINSKSIQNIFYYILFFLNYFFNLIILFFDILPEILQQMLNLIFFEIRGIISMEISSSIIILDFTISRIFILFLFYKI